MKKNTVIGTGYVGLVTGTCLSDFGLETICVDIDKNEMIQHTLNNAGKNFEFDVVSNPEFLREGNVLYDFTHPDKVVLGSESERAKDIMKNVYRVLFLNQTPFIFTKRYFSISAYR
jgi:UDP-glucose 6-dehydrogenase